MSYVVDHKKLPKQLLFELFKDANDLPFTIDDLTFANVSASSKEGYGTKVEVRWSTNHDIIGKINVYYNRMDLATLFSLSGLTVSWIYLDPADSGIILNDKVFAEITRRYGVVFTADDFDLSQTETGYLLSAKETNLAYTGSQHIDVKFPNFFIKMKDPLVYDGYSEVPTIATVDPMTAIAYDGYSEVPTIATIGPMTAIAYDGYS